jgi:hypothetical protein
MEELIKQNAELKTTLLLLVTTIDAVKNSCNKLFLSSATIDAIIDTDHYKKAKEILNS